MDDMHDTPFSYPDIAHFPDMATIMGSSTEMTMAARNTGALPPVACDPSLGVALIDPNRFSQECLGKAFEKMYPAPLLHLFDSAQEFLEVEPINFALILLHFHSADAIQPLTLRTIARIRDVYATTPIVVLSAAADAQQPKVIRKLLEAGALGVIATQTTGISMSLAVIRFVQAGGTFVPPDTLLAKRQERQPHAADKSKTYRLTARQMAVLAHLDRGSANKLIAYELGMSESTVKVHVRNIMRKMNATNRSQAVYKARKIWTSEELDGLADG